MFFDISVRHDNSGSIKVMEIKRESGHKKLDLIMWLVSFKLIFSAFFLIRFTPLLSFPSASLFVMRSERRRRVPGRQSARNGYVTALRCPGIYLIISVNEVGEAPKPPGLQSVLVCSWLTTIYLWFLLFSKSRKQEIVREALHATILVQWRLK